MKIIRQGIKPVPITKRFTCQNCGCIFETTSDEGIRMIEIIEHLFRTDTRHFVPVACPTCGKLHRIYLD